MCENVECFNLNVEGYNLKRRISAIYISHNNRHLYLIVMKIKFLKQSVISNYWESKLFITCQELCYSYPEICQIRHNTVLLQNFLVL